jgi:Uma2 family endonuclease
MRLDDFLRWDDGTDTRYELIRGVPVPREVQPAAHGMMAVRLSSLLHDGLKAPRDYAAQLIAAIASPSDAYTCYLADIAVAPTPEHWGDQLARDPVLIVEILSSTSFTRDYRLKRPDYCKIASVREVLLIDSEAMFADLVRRDGDRWVNEIVCGHRSRLSLASIGIEISMAELYDGLALPDDPDR